MKQEIRFCTTADGVRLAYATAGTGPPILRTGNWFTHLEFELDSPVWQHVLAGLSEHRTLVRYDVRGTGLSDREVGEITFDRFVNDLATVADAAGLDRFPLLGISQGGAVSIAYAQRHPERVSHLILLGTYAIGQALRSGAGQGPGVVETYRRLIHDGWGSDDPSFRELFGRQFLPGGTPEQLRWFSELERVSAAPETAERIFAAVTDANVEALLPRIAMPTLVLHCRGDRRVPFETGRAIAAAIPNARFVPLESDNHLFLAGEPATEVFFREVAQFLGDATATRWKRGAHAARLQNVAQQVEANPYYKLLGALALFATLVSFAVWLLT